MPKRLGRIRDVARAAGVSTATVSRVMNGAQNVRPETREHVLRASRNLNYLPNPAARTLSTNRTKTIAAVVPTLEYSIFAKYLTAIEQTLAQRGYSLVIALSNFDSEEELMAARKLLGMGAEAFILSGIEHCDMLVDLFDTRSIPFVFTSVWDPHCPVPTVGYDNAALAHSAIDYLVAKGHREISVIHGPLDNSDRTRMRKSGALAAEREQLALSFYETELSVAGGKQAATSILRARERCTAVLCFSDVLALGCIFALQEHGIAIPDDISVMGFDNLDWTPHVTPALTTINLPVTEMGESVARQLIDFLENDRPIAAKLLAGSIVERSSVAEAPRLLPSGRPRKSRS